MDDRRIPLASHVDKRVAVEGVFERLTETRGRKVSVALVQDVIVTVNGEQIDLGHVWVQNAENFINIEPFERVTFLARVGIRKRVSGNGDVEKIYNLMYPTEIRSKAPLALRIPNVVPRQPEPETNHVAQIICDPEPAPPTPEPATRTSDPVQLLLDVSALAERAGGWKNLEAIVKLLQK